MAAAYAAKSKQPRRIVLTGASGVGKTSLAVVLAGKLQLPVIPELGRQLCQDMGYARIGDIPDQEAFKQKVLAMQIEHENALAEFISDRSTIDCWVLWQRWNICQAMTYDSEAYYQASRQQAQSYSHVIYVPSMFEPPADDFRWTDPDYQKQIDRLVRATIFDWQLSERCLTLSRDNVEARLQEVLAWLGS